ncbi:MAG: hypothetical protein JW716_05285 [Candidatus Aenigmarchaeota archaeon]|nr:hypothetical protein [Candidatus Aenigmarchaeota archaeon]
MKRKKISLSIFVCFMFFVFMACSVNAAQPAVNTGTAGNLVVTAKSGIFTATEITSIIARDIYGSIYLRAGDVKTCAITSSVIDSYNLDAYIPCRVLTEIVINDKHYWLGKFTGC